MKQGLTAWDWKHIGSVLADSDSVDQTDFFKAFVKECNSWGTRYQVEQQLAEVNMKLTPEERETLSMIGFKGDK